MKKNVVYIAAITILFLMIAVFVNSDFWTHGRVDVVENFPIEAEDSHALLGGVGKHSTVNRASTDERSVSGANVNEGEVVRFELESGQGIDDDDGYTELNQIRREVAEMLDTAEVSALVSKKSLLLARYTPTRVVEALIDQDFLGQRSGDEVYEIVSLAFDVELQATSRALVLLPDSAKSSAFYAAAEYLSRRRGGKSYLAWVYDVSDFSVMELARSSDTVHNATEALEQLTWIAVNDWAHVFDGYAAALSDIYAASSSIGELKSAIEASSGYRTQQLLVRSALMHYEKDSDNGELLDYLKLYSVVPLE